MNRGKMKHRIVLQSRSATAGAIGGQSATWTDTLTRWAEIRPLTGHALFSAQSVHAEVNHLIVVEYAAALSNPATVAAMRATFKGRIFSIHACINVGERNTELHLMCSEGANNG